MPRPKPAKERPVQVAVICNLTEQFYVESRSYGNVPILPIIPGVQYIGRCAVNREKTLERAEDGKVELIESGGMVKELIGKCKPGEEFALTEVMDARAARQETGEKVSMDRVEAYDIADDVVNNINKTLVTGLTSDGALSFAGVFVCHGDEPTQAELKENREKLKACDEARVQTADSAWATYKNQMFCVDAIPAAKRLGIEDRDWLSTYKPTKDCPVCYTKLDPRAIVCRQCNHVLDEQASIKSGYLKPVAEPKPKTI